MGSIIVLVSLLKERKFVCVCLCVCVCWGEGGCRVVSAVPLLAASSTVNQ